MICPRRDRDKIFVVDARPKDYEAAVQETTDSFVEFQFFANGRDALRSNPDEQPKMWVVNMKLADMSGTDLYSMLRSRGCNTPIVLVGNDYSVEDEMNARCSGATLYFTKPMVGEWILAAGTYAM